MQLISTAQYSEECYDIVFCQPAVSLAAAVKNIAINFYTVKTSSIFVLRNTVNRIAYYKQSELINDVLALSNADIAYVIEDASQPLGPFGPRHFVIIFIDSYWAFR